MVLHLRCRHWHGEHTANHPKCFPRDVTQMSPEASVPCSWLAAAAPSLCHLSLNTASIMNYCSIKNATRPGLKTGSPCTHLDVKSVRSGFLTSLWDGLVKEIFISHESLQFASFWFLFFLRTVQLPRKSQTGRHQSQRHWFVNQTWNLTRNDIWQKWKSLMWKMN